MKLLFDNDWLRRRISSDPDIDISAGPNLEESVMSWNFACRGANKAESLEKFKAALEADQYVPADRKPAVLKSAETLVETYADDQVTAITTYGHINPDGTGNMKVGVND